MSSVVVRVLMIRHLNAGGAVGGIFLSHFAW